MKKSEIVAGPFHPAFRQLVEASIWYDAMVNKNKTNNSKSKVSRNQSKSRKCKQRNRSQTRKYQKNKKNYMM